MPCSSLRIRRSPVLSQLNTSIVRALHAAEVQEKLSGLGMEAVGNSPGDAAKIHRRRGAEVEQRSCAQPTFARIDSGAFDSLSSVRECHLNSPGPLAGVKVLELGTLIAGPFCARLLGEFGAEVIKIETPEGGDQIRGWRKMYEGTSLWWYVQARTRNR
jgi:hypothetical protein